MRKYVLYLLPFVLIAFTPWINGKTVPKFECPRNHFDVGCKCINQTTSKNLVNVIERYQQWLKTAQGGHYDRLKMYAKAWSSYEAYMQVSKHCKSMSTKTKKAYLSARRKRIKAGKFMKLCLGLKRKLKRSLGYKKRFKGRLAHLKKLMDMNVKVLAQMSADIKSIQKYSDDSCRFMMQVYTYRKSVAWVTIRNIKHHQYVLSQLYKPLLTTLKKQIKEHDKTCQHDDVTKARREHQTMKYREFRLKRLYNRFRTCARHAYYFAHLEVQNKMLIFKHKAREAKAFEDSYRQKLMTATYRLCVRDHGFFRCKHKQLLFQKFDSSRKKWVKIVKKLKDEFPEVVNSYEKWLPKDWKRMKLKKMQKKLMEKYKKKTN